MNRRAQSNEREAPQPLRGGGAHSVDERAAAKLIEGYPLPPPDDLTVQRIWQRVASAPELRASTSRPRWLDILAPSLALCFALALCFVVLRGRTRHASPDTRVVETAAVAELAAARGGVFFSRPAERWQPGEEGQALAEGQSVRTDQTGQAVMDVFGIASILISRGTDIAIERLNGGVFLRLSRGSVVARVSKRPPSEPFLILTHRFSVKVVGTLFRVDQSPGENANERTAIAVREGVVEVTGADGRSWRVSAGQAWSSVNPQQLSASGIGDAVKTLLEDGLKRASPSELDRELSAVNDYAASAMPRAAEPAAISSFSPAREGKEGRLETAERFTAPTPLHLPPVPLAAREAPETAPRLDSPPTSVTPSPMLLATREPAAVPPVGSYADGLALERAGNIRAAADDFIRAEKSDPAHAELALYALGRLRQHRLRDPQGALEAFETYRSTYPNGALLAEVDLAVLEVEVAAGQRDQAFAESARFLASHPASERTVEVHLLRGDLLRERGDCRTALAEYRQVDTMAFPSFGDDALFEIAYCERRLGDSAAARESLRLYRQRYPAGTHRDDVAKALRE